MALASVRAHVAHEESVPRHFGRFISDCDWVFRTQKEIPDVQMQYTPWLCSFARALSLQASTSPPNPEPSLVVF